MFSPKRARPRCGLLTLAFALASGPASATVDYQRALQLAQELDPQAAAVRQRAEAAQQDAVADSQWADPVVRLGTVNLPTDSFAFDEQPMTQKLVGVSQKLPRGDSARLAGERGSLQAQAGLADAADRELRLALQVSEAFLQLAAQLESLELMRENRHWLVQLVDYDRARVATGEAQSQQLLQSQLALARLDDRIQALEGEANRSRGLLSQWIGAAAWEPIDTTLPAWPGTTGWLAARTPPVAPESVAGHPALAAAAARVEAEGRNVEIAGEAYKPQWQFELSYGQREPTPTSDGADFASAMVSFDLPLFTGKRQDRRLAAARARESAGILQRQDLLQSLHSGLNGAAAVADSLAARRHLYRSELLPTAEDTASALLSGYASNTADLDAVIAARVEAIETQIDAVQLDYDYYRALARIRYYRAEAPGTETPARDSK
ncbi:TolC family protein [Microbulbifer sediminum]|uniref:TolC family protein n=1 Tax=Microbulbifer sediminum TaxID=2904250 RepID=UPI001F473E89|nr:TolC family protein [Microbulbifer sediminum]